MVTFMAQSNPIFGAVTKAGVLSPRLDVVRVQFPATPTAMLACPVVTREDHGSKFTICRGIEIGISYGASTTLPVRMCWTDQVFVARGDASGPLASAPYSGSVLNGQWLTTQRTTDTLSRLTPSIRSHELRLPILLASTCRNLLFDIVALAWVVVQIGVRHLARVGAELFSAPSILRSALLTYPAVNARHT